VERQFRPERVQSVCILLTNDNDRLVSGVLSVLEPTNAINLPSVHEPPETGCPDSERTRVAVPRVLRSEDRRSVLHSVTHSGNLARDHVYNIGNERADLLS
jgi:hypothetical protein